MTVIDSNKLVLQEAQSSLDINVVHGNGATLKIQKMANVPGSDLLIAATSADEINLLCCIMPKSWAAATPSPGCATRSTSSSCT